MSDLTDFLLARIAEDEAGASGELAAHAGRLSAEWRGVLEGVLVEAEARRHIVTEGLESALRALATMYVDHPDYRAEWS